MTDYKATPEQWEEEQKWVEQCSAAACLFELRARVEALEANAKPTPNQRPIRSSLVKRVHSCIVGEPECGHMQARAVIREVAAWLREQSPVMHRSSRHWAEVLEQEAER